MGIEASKIALERLVRGNISPYEICAAKQGSADFTKLCDKVVALYQSENIQEFESLSLAQIIIKVKGLRQEIGEIVANEFQLIKAVWLPEDSGRAWSIFDEAKQKIGKAFDDSGLDGRDINKLKDRFRLSKTRKCMKVLAGRIEEAELAGQGEVQERLEGWLKETIDKALGSIFLSSQKKNRNGLHLLLLEASLADEEDGYKFTRRDFRHPEAMRRGA